MAARELRRHGLNMPGAVGLRCYRCGAMRLRQRPGYTPPRAARKPRQAPLAPWRTLGSVTALLILLGLLVADPGRVRRLTYREWLKTGPPPIAGGAADLFFVGNGTNYSAAASWSATTGGAGGAGTPTTATPVHFDANSPGNCTIDTSCFSLTFDCTGYTHTITFNINTSITVNGNLFKLVAGMGWVLSTGNQIAFGQITTGTVAITTAGKLLPTITTGPNTATTATYQFQDAVSLQTATTVWTHTAGTIDTNNQAWTLGSLSSNNSNTRALLLGSSTITVQATGPSWIGGFGAGLTVTPGTSTLIFTAINAAPQFGNAVTCRTYYNLVYSGGGTMSCGVTTAPLIVNNNLTVTAVSKVDSFSYQALTVSGTFTVNATATNRMLLWSTQVGLQVTITAAVLAFSGVIDFMDTKGAGAATWTTAGSGASNFGDCGGNSSITFDASVTQTWVGTSGGNWSDATKWTGRTPAIAPLPQDDVIIASAFSAGQLVVADMQRAGRNVNWTGTTGNPTWTGNPRGVSVSVFGSLTCVATMVVPVQGGNFAQIVLAGRSSFTFTSAGVQGGNGIFPAVQLNAPGGTYVPTDNNGGPLNNSRITMINGTWDASVNNITMNYVQYVIAATATVKMGSGQWIINNSGTPGIWSGGTMVPGTSTIVVQNTSAFIMSIAAGSYANISVTAGGAPITFQGALSLSGTLTLNPNRGYIFTSGATFTAPTLSAPGQHNNGYLALPGVASNYASAPTSAALQITGAMTVDAKITLPNWTAGVTGAIISKLNNTGVFGYELQMVSNGIIGFIIGTGTAAITFGSTVAVPFTPGQTGWIRASWTAGSGTNFYTSTDGVTWTQLGTLVGNASAMSADVSALNIGGRLSGTQLTLPGNFYRTRIYNSALGAGSGTPVFDADFSTKPFNVNTFTESSVNAATVTVNGAGAQAGDGRVQISSTTPGTQATLQVANPVNADWLVLQDSKIQSTGPYFAGSHSVNVSNNTGWLFSTPAPLTLSAAASSADSLVMASTAQLSVSAMATGSPTLGVVGKASLGLSSSATADSALTPSYLAPMSLVAVGVAGSGVSVAGLARLGLDSGAVSNATMAPGVQQALATSAGGQITDALGLAQIAGFSISAVSSTNTALAVVNLVRFRALSVGARPAIEGVVSVAAPVVGTSDVRPVIAGVASTRVI